MLTKEESGRSLVEMMGTLAIMGILAIAGIWMYNSAMNKLKANTIINEAQKRAVVVAGQIGFQGRTNPSLEEFTDNTFAGGTFSTSVITSGLYEQFGIQVSNISKNVCLNILNSIGDGTALRRLTGVGSPRTALTTCAENNTILMVYNNGMTDKTGDAAYTCEKDSDCSVCGTCNTETHVCENECVVPEVAGGCDFDNECNANNKCMICNEETHLCEDGCQRVEYLESTGTQYVNTDYKANTTKTVYETKIVPTNLSQTQALFGSRNTANASGSDSCVSFILGTSIRYDWAVGGSSATVNISKNTPYEISITRGKLILNGTAYTSTTNISSVNQNYNFYVGNLSNGSSATYTTGFIGKIYYAKLITDSIVVRDLVPVHASFKTDGKQNCLFDRVSGNLFCNAANGADFSIP